MTRTQYLTRYLALSAITLATLSLPLSGAFAEDAPKAPPADEKLHDGPPPADGPKSDAERQERFEKRGREMFEKTDTDKDGFISKAELEASQKARMEEMFEKTDTDKDGKLSPDELRKGREAMRERFKSKYREQGEGRDGDRGGPPPEGDKPAQ